VAYTILVVVMFIGGFVLGAFTVFRRNGDNHSDGAERVDSDIRELGDQQQSITDTSNSIVNTSNDMGKQIQRGKDILAGIRERNKQGNSETKNVENDTTD